MSPPPPPIKAALNSFDRFLRHPSVKFILYKATDSEVESVRQIIYNVLYNKELKLTTNERLRLKTEKTALTKLAQKTVNLKTKRKQLSGHRRLVVFVIRIIVTQLDLFL